jgi:hypothetical protein
MKRKYGGIGRDKMIIKMISKMNKESGVFRVLLIGIGDNSEEKREVFCKNLSENYGISYVFLKKIVDRCPMILKKNLSQKKAESLAKTLKSFGAIVSVEKKIDSPPISLEFQEMTPHRVALEATSLLRTQSGAWNVIGRVRNISKESLNDTWVLIQLFNDLEEFLTFEEVPIPINPLPPGEASPFKVVFEGDLPIKRISIALKNSSGSPIPAVDRRKKQEWVEVKIRDEGEGKPYSVAVTKPAVKFLIEKDEEPEIKSPQYIRAEVSSLSVAETPQGEAEVGETFLEKTLSLKSETIPLETLSKKTENGIVLTLKVPEKNENPLEEKGVTPSELEPLQKFTLETKEVILHELEPAPDYPEKVSHVSISEASRLEEEAQLLEKISSTSEEVKKEGPPLFTWLESFRNSIEHYYQKPRDIFSIWFEEYQKEDGFADFFHSLLTILIHARFDQMDQSEKALENTQRVFRLIVQPNLPLEEIPPLEGMKFFSGENLRELFHRAIPKLQKVTNDIFKKKKWEALELERLIQVIPHMSEKNSRWAVRWMKELIPDAVEIDFSNTLISVGENLYRVASRLGVVDPYFDYYQGRNSMGDIKIQSFAKEAYPHDPIKIEEPIDWVGREEGGHCFPTQPRCEGCLFETFCPKLHVSFNPSEKGMKGQ